VGRGTGIARSCELPGPGRGGLISELAVMAAASPAGSGAGRPTAHRRSSDIRSTGGAGSGRPW